MSYYEREASDSTRPKKPIHGKSKTWTNQLLTNDQKAKLSIAARAAWDIQSDAGLVDGPFDVWRYDQTEVACGIRSLRDARNTHFRAILAHFLKLAGRTEEADAIWKKTGRVSGSGEAGDTHENREVARAILTRMVAQSRGLIDQNYVTQIAIDKFPGKDLQDLTAWDLQQLVITVKNRITKKRRA